MDLDALFDVDPLAWQVEADEVDAFFAGLGDRVPEPLQRELATLRTRLDAAPART